MGRQHPAPSTLRCESARRLLAHAYGHVRTHTRTAPQTVCRPRAVPTRRPRALDYLCASQVSRDLLRVTKVIGRKEARAFDISSRTRWVAVHLALRASMNGRQMCRGHTSKTRCRL